MGEILFGIVLLAFFVPIFIWGIRYLKEIKNKALQNGVQPNKQEYVKQNRGRFGVSNRGTSMDGCEIYSKSPADLGL